MEVDKKKVRSGIAAARRALTEEERTRLGAAISRRVMEHPAVQAMLMAMTADPAKARDYAQLLCCQAQLMADLPLEDPAAYTALVCKLMQ